MAYILVLVIAVAVGFGVYMLPGRSGRGDAGAGAGSSQRDSLGIRPPDEDGRSDGTGYIPVVDPGTSWYSRMGGVLGLIVVIGVGSVLLAVVLYQAGSLISRMFSG